MEFSNEQFERSLLLKKILQSQYGKLKKAWMAKLLDIQCGMTSYHGRIGLVVSWLGTFRRRLQGTEVADSPLGRLVMLFPQRRHMRHLFSMTHAAPQWLDH